MPLLSAHRSDPLVHRDENAETIRQFTHPLARILAFFELSIDDVVNERAAKRKVAAAFKASRAIARNADARRAERRLRYGLHR